MFPWSRCEPDLDKMAQQGQNYSSPSTSTIIWTLFMNIAITKSIIELTDPSTSYDLVKNRSKKSSMFNDNKVVFCDNNQRELPNSHNRLYMSSRV